MNWRLVLISHFQPEFIVKRKLLDLIRLTGLAFDMDPPDLRRCTLNEAVEQFARFTKTAAEFTLRQSGGHQRRVKEKLYTNAYQFGKNMRRFFHVRSIDEAMSASAILYKILKIQFHGDHWGEIVIQKCYFSEFYNEQTCEMISAIDTGVIAGLSGGGALTFTQRITEGEPCCRARLILKEES